MTAKDRFGSHDRCGEEEIILSSLAFHRSDAPISGIVSYPDPNVRNDDYRLQYNITYRGSGNEVVGNGS